MKYSIIYRALQECQLSYYSDHSQWRDIGNAVYGCFVTNPLWIIVESKRAGLRVWITGDRPKFAVTTADLTLPSGSRAYSESYQRREFSTQRDTAAYIREILSSVRSDAKEAG